MKYRLEWLYKAKNGKETMLKTEFLTIETILELAGDFEKTGRVKELSFYDENETHWTKKELEKLIKEVDAEPHDIILYFDGGYDKATKMTGIGVSIYYKKNGKTYRIRRNAKIEEIEDNNEAEYAALLNGIHILEELNVRHQSVTFRGDSQVVLKQLEGEWPCYEETLNRYLDRIEEKMKRLSIRPLYDPIDRKGNKEAHQLAAQALEGTMIDSHKEIDG